MCMYYRNYLQKVDLGVLETCNRMGFGQPVTETDQFFLTIRDDYLMVGNFITLLLLCVLSVDNGNNKLI